MDFTDGLDLLSSTHEQMEIRKTSVATAPASVGFKINKGKTKILICNTVSTKSITLDGEALDDVQCFTKEESDVYVRERIGRTATASLQLKNTWDSKHFSNHIKVTTFNTNVKTVDSTVLS